MAAPSCTVGVRLTFLKTSRAARCGSRRPRPCLVLPVTARWPSTDVFLSPVPRRAVTTGAAAWHAPRRASAAGPSPSAAGASLPLGARPLPKSFAIEWTKLWDRPDAILLNIFSDLFNTTAGWRKCFRVKSIHLASYYYFFFFLPLDHSYPTSCNSYFIPQKF